MRRKLAASSISDLSLRSESGESSRSLIDEADITQLLRNAAEKIMVLTEPSVLALYHFSHGDHQASVNMIERSLANNMDDDDAFAYNLWGLVKYKKARRHKNDRKAKTLFEDAVKMYKLALNLNKPKGEAYVTYNNLGAAYFDFCLSSH